MQTFRVKEGHLILVTDINLQICTTTFMKLKNKLSKRFAHFSLPAADLAVSAELQSMLVVDPKLAVLFIMGPFIKSKTDHTEGDVVCLSKMFTRVRPRGPLRVGPPQAIFDLLEREGRRGDGLSFFP